MESAYWIFASLLGGAFVAAFTVIAAVLVVQDAGGQVWSGSTLGFLFFGLWGSIIVLTALLAMTKPFRAFFANFYEQALWIPEIRDFPRDDD
jgi:hypothetical protein